jgi:hypothetical protein
VESIGNEAWHSPRSALSTPFQLLVSLVKKRYFTCRQYVRTSSSRVVGVSSAPLTMYRVGRLIYVGISRNYFPKGLDRSLPYLDGCEIQLAGTMWAAQTVLSTSETASLIVISRSRCACQH